MICRFVLVRDDGKYVARSGSLHSYVARLEDAQIFSTYAAADQNRCGNERVKDVADILMGGLQ